MPPLSPEAAVAQVRVMLAIKKAEAEKLDRVHAYLRGKQPHRKSTRTPD